MRKQLLADFIDPEISVNPAYFTRGVMIPRRERDASVSTPLIINVLLRQMHLPGSASASGYRLVLNIGLTFPAHQTQDGIGSRARSGKVDW